MKKKIKILIPIYNDWKSAFKLLESIDQLIFYEGNEVSIFIVNDGSLEQKPNTNMIFKNLASVQIINMKNNKGHARSIAAGLKYIYEKVEFDYLIPMDGDGEDRPEELNPLIRKIYEEPNTIITANRVKRSENFIFKFCYIIHKLLTFILTGQSIKFGNYTCLSKEAVAKIVREKSTWNSFSGSLAKLFQNRKFIQSIRGSRYFGPSKMSFINLLKHSLSIISVFKKTAFIRIIIFLTIYFFIISSHISLITLTPIFFIFIIIISVFILSKRENIDEFNNSLENINDIEILK
ncbi:MAG: glycosyl transferase [Candidatus Pelagibacter sp. TMED64]|nr:glycosyl transferase [Candidatus Pelagibacter sp.]OUU67886.1 MAG: glycosyl transferase [Candidatus Pelagibacter sp. TMED64]|tara:strand:+ start:7980 stop:8855 length:876 start_codon:yes stop_codon:yes gene_type:complete